jgi:protein O-mannosyl-transferase
MKSRIVLYVTIFLLAATTLAVYWNIDKCGFISFDDQIYVYENYTVRTGFTKENITRAFTTFISSNWHPLTILSHMLDCQLYGIKPAGHHLTNLLFHIFNTLLLFFLLKSITGAFWRSALVAALFSLHPLHVESVVWVSERKDVLSTFFMLLTVMAYVKFITRKKLAWYGIALFLFGCGLMAKSMLVTLPCLLLLLDVWPLGRIIIPGSFSTSYIGAAPVSLQRLLIEKIPFFLFSSGASVMALISQKDGGSMIPTVVLPVFARFYNASLSYVEYLVHMVWPFDLSFFYPLPTIYVLRTIYAALIIVSITILVILLIKKKPYLFVGWFWYLGMVVPVIGIVQVGGQALADRYTYMPLTGIFIMLVWLFSDVAERFRIVKTAVITGSICVLAILAFQTRIQAGYWKNDMTLGSHGVDVDPENYIAYNIKGNYLLKINRRDEAGECFSKALSLCPSMDTPLLNIGWIYLAQGKNEKALAVFNELLKRDSTNALANLNCGTVYGRMNENEKALQYYLRALKKNPRLVPALYNTGLAYAHMNEYVKAIPYFQQVLALQPDYPNATTAYRKCLEKQK